MLKNLRFSIVILISFAVSKSNAQSCSNLNLTWKSDIASTCSATVMTMIHDAQGKPYLYVANKEAGLKVYDITDPASPQLKKTIAPSLFGNMDVMNLCQSGSYVYLAIGNHFNKTQTSGMAIVKVDTPSNAWLTDYWQMPSSSGGAGVVAVEGNYAYLGAMGNGMAILDVSDKQNIVFKSKIKPDINYPTASPNPDLYNCRGMVVKNKIVYLCFDAGGIRIINVSDPTNPKETGHYSNPALNGKARAYNNCQLDDSILYIGCDYCGVEVLNVKDTSKIKLIGKWNPYNCPNSNWFTSPVHANEVQLDKTCKLLFVATAKSDLHVLNVSDPTHPDSCNIYGGVGNSIGTWGVGLYESQVYLSYVCSVIPFSSNWTGVKILSFTRCAAGLKTIDYNPYLTLKPNPAKDEITIAFDGKNLKTDGFTASLINTLGQKILEQNLNENQNTLNLKNLPVGVYFVVLQRDGITLSKKFIKE